MPKLRGPYPPRECPLCKDMFTVIPAQHFLQECVHGIGCPSCGVKGRNIFHAIDCAELMRICMLLQLSSPKKKVPVTIAEQIEECDWLKEDVQEDGITIIDERGTHGEVC